MIEAELRRAAIEDELKLVELAKAKAELELIKAKTAQALRLSEEFHSKSGMVVRVFRTSASPNGSPK